MEREICIPLALHDDLGARRVRHREVITTSVVADLGGATNDILGHKLVRLVTVVDQNGDIAVSGQVLRVLEGIENDSNSNELLRTTMDDSISVIATLSEPKCNSITEEVLSLSADSELKYSGERLHTKSALAPY